MPSERVRLHTLAAETKAETALIVKCCRKLGIDARNNLSTVTSNEADRIREALASISRQAAAIEVDRPALGATKQLERLASTTSTTAGATHEGPSRTPAASLFFVASLVSLSITIALNFAISRGEHMRGSPSDGPSGGADPVLHISALAIGVRHFLRLSLVDTYAKRGLLPERSPALYWLIFCGTIAGSISFTLRRFGPSWYYVAAVIPYLAIFILTGLLLALKVSSVKDSDEKDVFIILAADIFSVFIASELYEMNSGIQAGPGLGFWSATILWLLFVSIELSKIYLDTLKERGRQLGIMLGMLATADESA